jgi:hypothetical protein
MAEKELRTVFRLTTEPPSGLDPKRHLAAAGFAAMTWGQARHLQVVGSAEGFNACHGLILDAIE